MRSATIHRDDNGRRHSDNGPAIIYPSGRKSYWIHGKQHNEHGPAVICANGYKEYWIRNVYCHTANEYQRLASLSDEQMTMIILKHGPIT